MSTSTLDTLPVEILYRLFDNLDIETIVLSLRYVCKHLYLTTSSYNRYRLNFKSISKPNFLFICQLIPFENVISLTLSNDDKTREQIQLFLSLFNIEQLTRLQSLTLTQIDDYYLNIFLNYILSTSLKSLSITMESPRMETYIASSSALLTAAIAHPTLVNLYLNIGLKDWNEIQWPNHCTLQYLRLVNSITLKYLCLILTHSPCLKTLVLKEIKTDDYKFDSSITSFKQLTSLTFEDGRMEISKLDQCFTLTPCLTYLKLIGTGTLFTSSFDGYQWEKILQTKLHSLKTFEFFFSILTYSNYRSHNIESLINSYRTSFWLERINCFITCDYIQNSRKILLYTLPVCHTYFVYHVDTKKITLSNFDRRINRSDMDNVQNLDFNLTKDIKINSGLSSSNSVIFRNVVNLKLGNDGQWPKYSLQYLSTILDLSHIIKLSLSVNFIPEYMSSTVLNLNLLFNQAFNLRSLFLYDYWTPVNCIQRMEVICSIISSNIRHLQIRVKDFEDIKYILERLEHLTSVTFEYAQMLTIDREEFMQSLTNLNRQASMWNSQHALHVWFGNRK
jgi:hypothetical protein